MLATLGDEIKGPKVGLFPLLPPTHCALGNQPHGQSSQSQSCSGNGGIATKSCAGVVGSQPVQWEEVLSNWNLCLEADHEAKEPALPGVEKTIPRTDSCGE